MSQRKSVRGKTLGIGIIGAGLMGGVHAECFARDKRARIAGCVNRTASKAAELTQKYGGRVYATLDEMLADPAVDAVVVASTQTEHAAQITAAAGPGKHVLAEKPLALTAAELDRIEKAVSAAGVVVAVGHQMRLHPVVAAVKAYLAKIAPVYHLDLEWCFKIDAVTGRCWTNHHQGGFFMELGCHAMDLAQHLLGPVRHVSGHTLRLKPQRVTEDYTHCLLQFQSHAVGSVLVSANHRTKRQGLLIGRVLGAGLRIDFTCYPYARGMNRATLSVDGGTSVFVPDVRRTEIPIDAGPSLSKTYKGFFDMYQRQAGAFIDSVRDGRAPVCSLADGRAAVELVLAAYDSQAKITGKPNFAGRRGRFETGDAAHPNVESGSPHSR